MVLPIYGVDVDEALDFGLEAERLGYDSVWVEDHFMLWQLSGDEPTLEGCSLLSLYRLKPRRYWSELWCLTSCIGILSS